MNKYEQVAVRDDIQQLTIILFYLTKNRNHLKIIGKILKNQGCNTGLEAIRRMTSPLLFVILLSPKGQSTIS